jgi:hypothetical protein
MALPFSPNTTYVASGTPSIKAQDLNDLQKYMGGVYSASYSLKGIRMDGVGGVASAPTSRVEFLGPLGSTLPLLAMLNEAGAIRYVFDHTGYPIGGSISRFDENWLGPAVGATGSQWATTLGAGASIAHGSPSASYNSRYVTITPSTSGGATLYSLMSTALMVIANAAGMSLEIVFDVGLNAAAAGTASNSSWFFGLDAGLDPGGADVQLVGLYKKYNGAAWKFLSGAGGLQAIGSSSPSTNPTSGTVPVDRIKIELHGSGSPLGAYQALFYVNEAAIGSVVAANLPTVAVRLLMGSFNEGGVPAGGPIGYVGPITAIWNRLAAPAAF